MQHVLVALQKEKSCSYSI